MENKLIGLIESLKRDPDEVVLFVGAGLSINAGLPSWVELARPLAARIGYSLPVNPGDISVDHLLTAMQYFENQEGKNSLVRYLKEKLDTSNLKLSPAHTELPKLPIRLIFTTNYDDLLEKAYAAVGKPVNSLVGGKTLPYWDPKVIQIIKLCGDIQHLTELVITKSSFNTFAESHRDLIGNLRQALITKTVLFLGYSLQDPFINQVLDSIRLSFGNDQRRGFIVLFDPSNLEKKDLERRNLQVIELKVNGGDRSEIFTAWLENMVQQVSV